MIDSLDIDEIRWPLAGVKVTQRGVDGRLQAILRAHENQMGALNCISMVWQMIFFLMLVVGSGDIGVKAALRRCMPVGT